MCLRPSQHVRTLRLDEMEHKSIRADVHSEERSEIRISDTPAFHRTYPAMLSDLLSFDPSQTSSLAGFRSQNDHHQRLGKVRESCTWTLVRLSGAMGQIPELPVSLRRDHESL